MRSRRIATVLGLLALSAIRPRPRPLSYFESVSGDLNGAPTLALDFRPEHDQRQFCSRQCRSTRIRPFGAVNLVSGVYRYEFSPHSAQQPVVKVARGTEGGDAPGSRGATSENTGLYLSEE